MRTSATGTSSSNKGFTLLELVVVLVILAGVAALALPRLTALFDDDVRASARTTATLLRYLEERAVVGRTPYRLKIDLDQQQIRVVQLSGLGEEQLPDDPFLARNPLVGKTRIAELTSTRLGRVAGGTVSISYGPGGLAEPLVLRLGETTGRQYTVQALPVNGSVKVAEGWLELIQ